VGTLAGEKTLIDIVGTYNVTSALTLVLNFDWDQQQKGAIDSSGGLHDASWHAAALYVNYAMNDAWRVSLRGEYLDDKDGFVTGASQTLKEGTITFGYSPVKSFELRAEFRYDKSGAGTPTFFNTAAAAATFPANGIAFANSTHLSEFALQGVYKFASPPPAPTT
jgi:hypothetical protein